MWKKASLAAALLGLGIASAPASALTINQIMNTIGTDPYRFEDNDIEVLSLDNDGDGLLDVGDQLLALVEIEKIINEATGDEYIVGSGVNNSLSGISIIEVKSKVATGNPGEFDFEFGPAGGATGTLITFYEDAADDVNITNCGPTRADCITSVTNGTNIIEMGFDGSPWEQWFATGPDDPDLRSVPTSTDVGSFNFQLTILSSSIDIIQVGDPWNGSGSLQGCTSTATGTLIGSCQNGTGTTEPKFELTTDTQLSPFTPSVPEPGMLALLGMSLLGMFAVRRRRS
jgi:hypothetical protein